MLPPADRIFEEMRHLAYVHESPNLSLQVSCRGFSRVLLPACCDFEKIRLHGVWRGRLLLLGAMLSGRCELWRQVLKYRANTESY